MKKSRQELLAINPGFTKFILDLQLSLKPELYKEGENIILDLDKEEEVIVTKNLAERLNRDLNQEFEKNRDLNPFKNLEDLQFIESRLLISSKKNTHDYLIDIASTLENIRIALEEKELIILGEQNTPWLYQENEYLPVKNALKYLSKTIDKDFNGGFLLKGRAILEFIPHLFWLIRCNMSLPYFYISFSTSKTVISICKYGVLHFEFYDKKEKNIILELLSDLKFREVNSCNDPIVFDDFKGRRIKI